MNKKQKEVELAKLKAEEKELKHLKAIYNKASDDIAKKLKISNGKINVLLKDFDELDDVQKSILQSQIYQRNFQLSLKKQIDGFLSDLSKDQYKSIDEYLKGCYETGFLGSLYDLHGQNIPLIFPIDQKQAAAAIKLDPKISKNLYTKLGEDVGLLKKRIANNVSRGIATASEYKVIARNIAADSNVGFNRAMRIARTEGHGVQVQAAVDVQHKAKEKGADIVKQWDAALDKRTRESHRRVDGEIRELDEKFSNGMMHPSDPAGGAAEVVNCRCALLQRAKWALDEDELQTLKDRAAYFKLDKTENFDDFKKKYMEATIPKEKTGISPLDEKIESEALEWYVSGDGQWVNQYLRGRGDFGELSPREKELIAAIEKATSSETVAESKLFRSVDAEAVFGKMSQSEYEDLMNALAYGAESKNEMAALEKAMNAKGKTITEKGFMSTSKKYDVVADWGDFTGSDKPIVIEFEVPKGIKGKDLKAFDVKGEEQFEVLLAKNTKYKIKDINAKDGNIYLKAEIKAEEVLENSAKSSKINAKKISHQYKDKEALNEYDYYTEQEEKFRLNAIKELSGFNDDKAKETLKALCGTREEYLANNAIGKLGTDTGWFAGGDRAIRTLATPEAEKKAEIIHSYIMAAPKYDGTIYRGATMTKENLDSLKIGGHFSDNGALASWTTEKSVADNFANGRAEQYNKIPVIFEMEGTTKGTPTAHLSIFGQEENEVLVSNITSNKYVVVDLSEKDGITYIKLKEE